MRKLVFTVLVLVLTLNPCVVLAQRNAANHLDKQRAEQIADQFIERFEQTLDFGIVWKALRLSDPSCTQRANGILNEDDYANLKLSGDIVEKLYIATMNFYYLKNVYELSHSLIDSESEPASAPAEIEARMKRSKFFEGDEHKPQSQKEVTELIGTLDQLARLYRKHIPRKAMKSPVWRANEKYLRSRNTTDHEGVLNGSETFCIAEGSNVFIVDRGVFYFYLVNEGGKMRVAGLGID